jgi:methionyl aminopeptidase
VITVKSPAELAIMIEGGKRLAAILEVLVFHTDPGVTTGELDQIARGLFKDIGGEPTFLGFHGYPASICVSVNDEVVHGIPGSRVIRDSDVVGLDVGLRYQGFCTDTATTVIVGQSSPAVEKLVEVTEDALFAGIDQVKPGARIGDISAAIEAIIQPHRYGIVRDLAGHGIGRDQWEEPSIHNFGQPGSGPILKEGMTIAIEPMVTLGSGKVIQLEDEWTIATADHSVAAHFEHTVAVTKDGYQILT